MKRWAAIAFVATAACATARPSNEAPPWPDTAEVVGGIACAVEADYGSQVAREIASTRLVVRESYALAGRYDPGSETIYLAADARSARASALRHEMLYHRLPHLVMNDPKPCGLCRDEDHDPAWTPIAKKLDEAVFRCLRSSAENDHQQRAPP